MTSAPPVHRPCATWSSRPSSSTSSTRRSFLFASRGPVGVPLDGSPGIVPSFFWLSFFFSIEGKGRSIRGWGGGATHYEALPSANALTTAALFQECRPLTVFWLIEPGCSPCTFSWVSTCSFSCFNGFGADSDKPLLFSFQNFTPKVVRAFFPSYFSSLVSEPPVYQLSGFALNPLFFTFPPPISSGA